MPEASKSLPRSVIAETKSPDIKSSFIGSVFPFGITIRNFTINKLTARFGNVGLVGSNVAFLGVGVGETRLGLWDVGATEVSCAVVGIVVVGA